MVVVEEYEEFEMEKELPYKILGMEMVAVKRIGFDAAHYLPGYEGKCSQVHGHHWVVELGVRGLVKDDGMVVDFTLLGEFLKSRVHGRLDHTLLNDVIENPTAENICLWVKETYWIWFGGLDVRLEFIRIWETENSYVEVRG